MPEINIQLNKQITDLKIAIEDYKEGYCDEKEFAKEIMKIAVQILWVAGDRKKTWVDDLKVLATGDDTRWN